MTLITNLWINIILLWNAVRAWRIIFQVTYPRESEIKNLLSLPNFYFPIEAGKANQIFKGVWGHAPSLEILKYLMQNPAFWPYLKGLWCLKIIIFFFTLFCCLLSIWDLEFYLQFVQHWKIYHVIWHTLHKLNVLWTDHGYLELLSGPRHKITSHSIG